MTEKAASDHWPRHARQWALVGPPLRPCAEDTAVVEAAVAAWAGATGHPPRALVLGVTPELVGMRWPAGSAVTAIDRSAAMIAAMRRADLSAAATALQADWRALPCTAASVDVAVGDGSLSCLAFPGDYHRFAGELARVLVPDGELVLRLFASPVARETLDEVAAALAARGIASFHAFKWRLAMAIAGGGDVAVADIARAFDRVVPDAAARAALAVHTGWPLAVIATIDAYRGSDLVYSFPTRGDAVAALAPHFTVRAGHAPTYELGERCPTIVLGRAASAP